MELLSLVDLDRLADEFDAAVADTPGIDGFCSSTLWTLPAARALMPPRQPWVFRDHSGWLALMRGQHHDGWHYIEPLEAMWGLACPIAGHDGTHLSAALVDLCRQHDADWDVLILSGLPMGSPLLYHLVAGLLPHYELLQGQVTTRFVAALHGGLDGFLGRRSRNFRRALRRALRTADDAGIRFEPVPQPDDRRAALALYRRLQRIEATSWKGRACVGIDTGSMGAFYEHMVPRLAARGALRTLIARHQDRDVAFVLGGVFGTTYRGLQFSFHTEYAHLSLGNLCQYHQIVELCREGLERYDLGTGMDYKQRWAETTQDSLAIIARKH
jgi:hypothetical protein